MATHHLITGQNNCTPDGASSSNPIGNLANALLDQSSKTQDVRGNTDASHCREEGMALEYLSGSDGKGGIAKAASLLWSDFCNCDTHGYDKSDIVFTEADMACALRAVGGGGPEPDLLLAYGPVRCHLGFPAWRLRYKEIVHMGSLKLMKYGSIVKALYQFSQKYQNYGNMGPARRRNL